MFGDPNLVQTGMEACVPAPRRVPLNRKQGSMERAERWKIASGLNILVGLWLIIAPFVLGYSDQTSPTAASILFGFLIAVIAALRVFRMPDASWLGWVNVILGLGILFAPFYVNYGYTGNPYQAYVQFPLFNADSIPLWNSVIAGAIAAVLGAASALMERAETP